VANTDLNVLWITMDELHREALSCCGATSHKTPNVDRIAGEGMRFENAYAASPVCLPSRVSLATGLYPHRSRSFSNHTGASLSLSLPNVFQVFRSQGYQTSMHGKCHFIPVPYPYVSRDFTREYDHFRQYYLDLGIDHLDLQDGNEVSAWFYDDYGKDLEKAGLMSQYRDLVHNKTGSRCDKNLFLFPGDESMHPDSWVGRKAIEYLSHLDNNQPHFMWVSFSGPHYPLNTPVEYLSRVDMSKDRAANKRDGEWDDPTKSNCVSYHGPGGTEGSNSAEGGAQKNFDDSYWRQWRQMYYANVVQIDDYIGQILERAKALWGENLLVVFTCDHGDMMGHHGLWGKNGAFFEDIIRVPLFIRPPRNRGGSVHQELVSLVDVLPTCLDAAGIDPIQCDGKPLGELVAAGGRDYVLSETQKIVSIVHGSDKLTRHQRGETTFLEQYDLSRDPFEFDNVSGEPSGLHARQQMESILERLQREENLHSILFYDPTDQRRPPWLRL